MKMLSFASRTAKEIVRDPINIAFGLGFPIILIVLLSTIQANIPVDMFEIEMLAPGVTVFGLSFMTLFSAFLLSKDRESAFFNRLYTTPLTATDFVIGYTLPLIPIAMLQSIITYIAAMIFGFQWSWNILTSIAATILISVIFIAVGLISGILLTSKQVGGFCGALFTNITAWLSGIWFDVKLAGKVFENIAQVLPFMHAVELQRAVIGGNYSDILPHFIWVACYAVGLSIVAVTLFIRKMKKL